MQKSTQRGSRDREHHQPWSLGPASAPDPRTLASASASLSLVLLSVLASPGSVGLATPPGAGARGAQLTALAMNSDETPPRNTSTPMRTFSVMGTGRQAFLLRRLRREIRCRRAVNVWSATILACAPAPRYPGSMKERRRRRSERKDEALHLLLESVQRRSAISSIALVDGRGMVIAGTGSEHELYVLGLVAAKAAHGALDPTCERLTAGTDVMSCAVSLGDRRMYLAALGDRVSRMPEAARGVGRILRAS